MKQNKAKLTFFSILLIFTLVPLAVGTILISILLTLMSSKELEDVFSNSMTTAIHETGAGIDNYFHDSENTLRTFTTSPIVKEFLNNPNDAELQAKAQDYTLEFFNSLENWEGIYIADWNSKVLTHPAPPVIGKVMREGDRLVELQDAMLNAENGIYNVGIITSPASGQLIISMYMPIMDGDKPIGYVGAGTFIKNIAQVYSDVSSLGLETANIYLVDRAGNYIYHPNEEMIGQIAENEIVTNYINDENFPKSGTTEYSYEGINKFTSYFIGVNDNYLAVLHADSSDILSIVNRFGTISTSVVLILLVVFAILAFFFTSLIVKPLAKIADIIEQLSKGNINVDTDVFSIIRETMRLKFSAIDLQRALSSSIGTVKTSSDSLAFAVQDVDMETTNNVESITRINNAITEVASTSQVVAENAQVMAGKAMDLGQDVDRLTENIQKLAEETDSIKVANKDASEYMTIVMNSSDESVQAVNNITKKIAETNESIEKISACVKVIEDIAGQTNLLSLNASIEAARAGESGKGFAVVAEEIRKLADSSANSASEISTIIASVIELSNETVEVAEKVCATIAEEQNYIKDTQKKFSLLSSSVETSINEITSVDKMSVNLAIIKDELAGSIQELGAIAEELGASTVEVSNHCQQVTEACSETQARTEEMKNINNSLVNAIEFFKL